MVVEFVVAKERIQFNSFMETNISISGCHPEELLMRKRGMSMGMIQKQRRGEPRGPLPRSPVWIFFNSLVILLTPILAWRIIDEYVSVSSTTSTSASI